MPVRGFGARWREVSLDEVSFDQFVQNLNTVFTVHDVAGGAVEVRLAEVRSLPQLQQTAETAEDAGNEKFSLRFIGSAQQALSQDTYWFEHQRLGRFAIFVAPIGPADTGAVYYEAIFNRPSARSSKRARNFLPLNRVSRAPATRTF